MIRGHMLFEVKAVEEPLLVACLLAHHADVSPSFLLRLGPWQTSNVQSFSTQLARSRRGSECLSPDRRFAECRLARSGSRPNAGQVTQKSRSRGSAREKPERRPNLMSAGPNFNTSMPSLLLNPNHHQVAFTARVQHLGEQCNASCVGRWLAVLKGGCDGV